MFSLVAEAQGQTTELGKCPEAEGNWGAVPGQEDHLQVRRRIWGAADFPSATHSLAGLEGGQVRGRGSCTVSRRGRRDTPVYPGPVTRAHVAAIWPACCWGSPPGALLLTRTSAFHSRQRIWERSGLRAGAESQPCRGEQPPPRHPRDSPLDAGHHRCVTSLVQERGEAAGQGSSWGCRQVPSRPGVTGDTRGKGTAPSFLRSSYPFRSSCLFSRTLSSLASSLSFPASSLFFLSLHPSFS